MKKLRVKTITETTAEVFDASINSFLDDINPNLVKDIKFTDGVEWYSAMIIYWEAK